MHNTAKEFGFKVVDSQGRETLEVIAQAENFNRWMYEMIKPYCGGRVLEIGSGVGNISKFFIEDGFDILLTDIRNSYCDVLKQKFSAKKNLLGVANIDLVDKDFDTKFSKYFGSFDTLFSLNVIEHIKDDSLAVANCKKLLAKDGRLIILVPAYQWLYNGFDEELHHFRRYFKEQVISLFEASNFSIKRSFYFNGLGILGWFISGKIMKNRIIPQSQLKFYNGMIPLAKVFDWVFFRLIGLSVVVVGEKK